SPWTTVSPGWRRATSPGRRATPVTRWPAARAWRMISSALLAVAPIRTMSGTLAGRLAGGRPAWLLQAPDSSATAIARMAAARRRVLPVVGMLGLLVPPGEPGATVFAR